jgi:hypothetical protein
MRKALLRAEVPRILAEHGFTRIRVRSGQGILPGARLVAVKDGKKVHIAVKVSAERTLGFTKKSPTIWRTAGSVDLVVAVVPARDSGEYIEVLAFDSGPLTAEFEKAWQALSKAGRPLSFEIPIFIPLDKVSRKNLGHSVADLNEHASWVVRVPVNDIRERRSIESAEAFYNRVKREFAERSGVDVSKVEVEFRVKP